MAESEKPPSDASEGTGEDVGKVPKAGPAGVLLVAMIVLALLAIVVLGIFLLGRG